MVCVSVVNMARITRPSGSSPGRKPRPSSGVAPSRVKKSSLAATAVSRSGSVAPRSVALPSEKAASAVKLRLCSR